MASSDLAVLGSAADSQVRYMRRRLRPGRGRLVASGECGQETEENICPARLLNRDGAFILSSQGAGDDT